MGHTFPANCLRTPCTNGHAVRGGVQLVCLPTSQKPPQSKVGILLRAFSSSAAVKWTAYRNIPEVWWFLNVSLVIFFRFLCTLSTNCVRFGVDFGSVSSASDIRRHPRTGSLTVASKYALRESPLATLHGAEHTSACMPVAHACAWRFRHRYIQPHLKTWCARLTLRGCVTHF
jgi:hypothetical protein